MLSIYLNTDWLYYLVLIVCVGILQQLVFLFSCSVHKISTDDGSELKVFSFYSEQRKGVLTNFNLNVIIPNVVFLIAALVLTQIGLSGMILFVILSVPLYYICRWISICFILREKMFFKIGYEILYLVFGCLWAIFIAIVVLGCSDWSKILIFFSQNLWLLAVPALYLLTVILLFAFTHKKSAINEKMVAVYIAKKFLKFYKKYKKLITIDYSTYPMCIFLYAIMIVEHVNETKDERINKKNVQGKYDKIKTQIWKNKDKELQDEQIYDNAFSYRSNIDFAKSVTFVYRYLEKLIGVEPYLRSAFCIDEKTNEQDVKEQETQIQQEVAECLFTKQEEDTTHEEAAVVEAPKEELIIFEFEYEANKEDAKDIPKETPKEVVEVSRDDLKEEVLYDSFELEEELDVFEEEIEAEFFGSREKDTDFELENQIEEKSVDVVQPVEKLVEKETEKPADSVIEIGVTKPIVLRIESSKLPRGNAVVSDEKFEDSAMDLMKLVTLKEASKRTGMKKKKLLKKMRKDKSTILFLEEEVFPYYKKKYRKKIKKQRKKQQRNKVNQ